MAELIPFAHLQIGQRYKYLWGPGPDKLITNGILDRKNEEHGWAYFSDSRNSIGILVDPTQTVNFGLTKSSGPFYSATNVLTTGGGTRRIRRRSKKIRKRSRSFRKSSRSIKKKEKSNIYIYGTRNTY